MLEAGRGVGGRRLCPVGAHARHSRRDWPMRSNTGGCREPGHACDQRGLILLGIEATADGLFVEVCDCGRFSAGQAPDLESAGGRGIPIIAAVVDHLELLAHPGPHPDSLRQAPWWPARRSRLPRRRSPARTRRGCARRGPRPSARPSDRPARGPSRPARRAERRAPRVKTGPGSLTVTPTPPSTARSSGSIGLRLRRRHGARRSSPVPRPAA